MFWQDGISTSKFLINNSSNLQGAGPTNLARPLFKTAKLTILARNVSKYGRVFEIIVLMQKGTVLKWIVHRE
jgi:hypothetical protein